MDKTKFGERDVLRMVPYGLYILTVADESEVNAIACNWLTQISFDPLQVLIALENNSHSRDLIQANGVFAINLLSKEHIHLARRLAAPHRINPHKLVGITWHPGETGAPLLDDAIAFLECEVTQTVETGGDHTLFVGKVVAGEVLKKHNDPLTLLESGLRYK